MVRNVRMWWDGGVMEWGVRRRSCAARDGWQGAIASGKARHVDSTHLGRWTTMVCTAATSEK